jgi:CPA2 family monovalent cation:H+ antiporter-2
VVVPEEVETSMEIFSRVLEMYGVPREALVKHSRRIRAERYGLFRQGRAAGFADTPESLAGVSDLVTGLEARLVRIPPGAKGAGRTLQDLGLAEEGDARVLALLRARDVVVRPPPQTRLAPGDALVLLGDFEAIGSVVDTALSPAEPSP